MAAESNSAPLIVIVGETASGKTGFALELAGNIGGEIICADSRTIYRGMDIGTAKPDQSHRERVKHHMLDVVDPDQSFSAALFQKKAQLLIREIYDRGKVPIMVGGTGLYVDSVIFNYQFRMAADPQKRTKLEALTGDELVAMAREQNLDVTDPRNKRYLVRLLESKQNPPNNREELRPNTLVVGLTVNRTILRRRIEERVETMFKKGLRREIETLLERYGWDDPGMTGIGYREFRPYYNREIPMTKVKRKIVYDTLQLAKRQRTWFKRNPYIHWTESLDDVKRIVQEFRS